MLAAFAGTNPSAANFTALLNSEDRAIRTVIAGLPVIALVLILIYINGQRDQKRWRLQCVVFFLLAAGAVLFPYGPDDFLSCMHIVCTILTIADLQFLMYRVGFMHVKLRDMYLLGITSAWLISLAYDTVNGWAEILYVCTTCTVLVFLYDSLKEKPLS